MKVLIFEDERLSAERLIDLLIKYDERIEIMDIIDSVKNGITWFKNNPQPDLIFMDIRLADTISFELFEKVKIDIPVIFTTAYDEYALKAFKVNSVDYLVKPYDFKDLQLAIDKYKKTKPVYSEEFFKNLLKTSTFKYKQRFLVKMGDQFKHIDCTDIAYFKFEDGLVILVSKEKIRLPLDYSLDQLTEILDPQVFFRLNRKIIARIDAISKIHSYFNGRLKITLNPPETEETIISRDKAGDFKLWMGG
ncbi:MAG: response regulator transcription factor [Bacteroidales bacterium]|nr:response regulator transcription factor [Bacteroidales bacterium]